MKVISIVGARPQFVKAAAVSPALRSLPGVEEVLVHTGQHFDPEMSDLFFRELALPQPDEYLGIGGGTHGQNTGRMLEALEGVLLRERPDRVLVYGDTDTTLAGALAAAKLRIPVAHVEAGLRSFDRSMPEEINRIVADHLSDLLFAPTPVAMDNLAREGIGSDRAHLVGDVMYDLALRTREIVDARQEPLRRFGLRRGAYVVVTVHRAANTDDADRLGHIVGALCEIATIMPVVFPVHPRTRAALQRHGLHCEHPGLHATPPLGYLDMMALVAHAAVVATDSGGLQKEAWFYRVPCVTLREETEWVELVETGWNRLVPPTLEPVAIAAAIRDAVGTPGREVELYGGGQAARRVVEILVSHQSSWHSTPSGRAGHAV